MPGTLFPAYQKLYSALSCFNRFSTEASFIDNIASLDTFFSEFRNITFVIQKVIEDKNIYDKNNELYLRKLKWFIDERNKTTKEAPFQLIKEIIVSVYNYGKNLEIARSVFTIEEDVPLQNFLDELKNKLSDIDKNEVFFSAEFFFHEKNSDVDIIEKLLDGISSMLEFMIAMENDLKENCPLCNQLKNKIRNFGFLLNPKQFYKTVDYAYYPSKDIFEKAKLSSMELSFDGFFPKRLYTLDFFTKSELYNFDGTLFGNFTFMHAIIQSNQPYDIFPVFVIALNNGTCILDAFNSTIKTTLYRKIYEISNLIKNRDVTEVCYIGNVSVIKCKIIDLKTVPKISKERIAIATDDLLIGGKIDKNLNSKEYVFNKKFLKTPGYIKCVMNNGFYDHLYNFRGLFKPIQKAFELLNS